MVTSGFRNLTRKIVGTKDMVQSQSLITNYIVENLNYRN